MLTLTFHGHACFILEADGRRVIIDPFLTGNPATDIPLARLPKIDAVLLAGRVDAMLVPIGDNYTMGIEDAVRAVEFVQPRAVIPMHYNTWDVIKADPEQFKRQVGGRARVVVLAPGGAHTLS